MQPYGRSSSFASPSTPSTIPRKRNLSLSSLQPSRPPPPLRSNTTQNQDKEEPEEDDDDKDDYGDLGVNSGAPQEQNNEERERIR